MWRQLPSQFSNLINPEYEQESRLIEQARAGSERAFAALLARYQQPVFRIIYYLVGNEQDAYDLSYIALKYALRRLPRVPSGVSIRPWLLRVGVLVALDSIRERHQSPRELLETLKLPGNTPSDAEKIVDADIARENTTVLQRLDDAVSKPETAIADAWDELPIEVERELIRRLLATMPEQDAELLALGIIGQVPTHDLATIRGTSERSIRRRIARSLIMFHRYFLAVRMDALPQAEPVEQLPPPPTLTQQITGKLRQARQGVTEITQQVVSRIKEFSKPESSAQDARELLQTLRETASADTLEAFELVEPDIAMVTAAEAITIPIIERTLEPNAENEEDFLSEESPLYDQSDDVSAIEEDDDFWQTSSTYEETSAFSETAIAESPAVQPEIFSDMPANNEEESVIVDYQPSDIDFVLAHNAMPVDNAQNESVFAQATALDIPDIIYLPSHLEDMPPIAEDQPAIELVVYEEQALAQEQNEDTALYTTSEEIFADATDIMADASESQKFQEPKSEDASTLQNNLLPMLSMTVVGSVVEDAAPIAEVTPIFYFNADVEPIVEPESIMEEEEAPAVEPVVEPESVMDEEMPVESILAPWEILPDAKTMIDSAPMIESESELERQQTPVADDMAEVQTPLDAIDDSNTPYKADSDAEAENAAGEPNHLAQIDSSTQTAAETTGMKIQGIERRNYPPSSRLRKRRPNHSHRR